MRGKRRRRGTAPLPGEQRQIMRVTTDAALTRAAHHRRALDGAPARQSRQMAPKRTLRGAFGDAWIVRVKVLSATLRSRGRGKAKRPSGLTAAVRRVSRISGCILRTVATAATRAP